MLEEISYPKLLANDIGGPRKIMRNIKGLGLWKSWVLESLALKFGDLKWSSLINTSSQLIIYTNFLPSDLYDGGKNNTSWISSLLHSSDYCFLNPIFGRVSISLTFSPQILVWLHGSRDKKKLIFFNLLDLQTQRSLLLSLRPPRGWSAFWLQTLPAYFPHLKDEDRGANDIPGPSISAVLWMGLPGHGTSLLLSFLSTIHMQHIWFFQVGIE